jgi:hypothetical protein
MNLDRGQRDQSVPGPNDRVSHSTRRGTMRIVNSKSALVAAMLAVGALTATSIATTAPAEAHGFGFGHGFGGGHGFGWGHGFGHGFGHRHGWGGPVFGVYGGDYFADCSIRRYVNEDGDVIVRKVCY